MELAHVEQLIMKEELGVAYPLLMTSRYSGALESGAIAANTHIVSTEGVLLSYLRSGQWLKVLPQS